jgi:hypothetical protein
MQFFDPLPVLISSATAFPGKGTGAYVLRIRAFTSLAP